MATARLQHGHQTSQRVALVDIARAIAMFLVFFGHLGDSWFPALRQVLAAIYTFHMPLFFLLSGLFFKPGIPFGALLRRRGKTLLVPYYAFSCFALVGPIVKLVRPSLYTQIGKSTAVNPVDDIIGIMLAKGNSGLWFLWSLFVALICLWLLVKAARGNRLILLLVLLLCIVANYLLAQNDAVAQLPFQLGKIFEATGWAGLGYIAAQTLDIKRLESGRYSIRLAWLVVLILAFLALVYLATFRSIASDRAPLYYVLLFFTTVAGIAASICLSLVMPSLPWVCKIGRYSLVLYALNDLALKVTKFGLFSVGHIPVAKLPFWPELGIGLLVVITAMLLCYWANACIQRYARWSVGDF